MNCAKGKHIIQIKVLFVGIFFLCRKERKKKKKKKKYVGSVLWVIRDIAISIYLYISKSIIIKYCNHRVVKCQLFKILDFSSIKLILFIYLFIFFPFSLASLITINNP